MIPAVLFNHRITIQKRTGTLDAYGQEASTWSTVATVWADIRTVGSREKLKGMALDSTLSCTISIRYQAALMPPVQMDAWRIQFGDRYFSVLGGQNWNEMNEMIVFDCVEGRND